MNNVPMTAKEYLSRAYRIDQRINAKLMRISELRALAQKCTVAYGGARVSHTRNVASLEDAERFLTLGATRLGTSRIVKLVKQEHAEGY